MLHVHLHMEDNVLVAHRDNARGVWDVILCDNMTGLEKKCQATDDELSAVASIAIATDGISYGSADQNKLAEQWCKKNDLPSTLRPIP